ncbi:hypothetical protein Trydic_g23962 [Trypoxylus dichotomus]
MRDDKRSMGIRGNWIDDMLIEALDLLEKRCDIPRSTLRNRLKENSFSEVLSTPDLVKSKNTSRRKALNYKHIEVKPDSLDQSPESCDNSSHPYSSINQKQMLKPSTSKPYRHAKMFRLGILGP